MRQDSTAQGEAGGGEGHGGGMVMRVYSCWVWTFCTYRCRASIPPTENQLAAALASSLIYPDQLTWATAIT